MNKAPIPPVRLKSDLPAELELIIKKALEKDRDLRYQHASDMRTDLKRLRRDASSDRSEVAKVFPRRSRKLLVEATAATVVLIGLVLAWFLWPHAEAPPRELTQKRLTFNSSENAFLTGAISPDGKYLAYSDEGGMHVKLLSTGEERLIPGSADVPTTTQWLVASWFPDGTQLLVNTVDAVWRGGVWTVSLLGQSPRELREPAYGLGISPDGSRILFRPSQVNQSEIWVMESRGDNPEKVVTVGAMENIQAARWSPDGHRLAYIRGDCVPVPTNGPLKSVTRTVQIGQYFCLPEIFS